MRHYYGLMIQMITVLLVAVATAAAVCGHLNNND